MIGSLFFELIVPFIRSKRNRVTHQPLSDALHGNEQVPLRSFPMLSLAATLTQTPNAVRNRCSTKSEASPCVVGDGV